ncbi:TonB-dependent vitamin B12 receptor [Luteimonas mephitis]|uniref:TonB-dependent vitamin B12 receptor n=1 Tax=Luteimonas mephitis TaxID=83615 RepID=UPI0003F5578F|nr:TonB-dependent vitamin B12 receptor [Luteimonas mephitis]
MQSRILALAVAGILSAPSLAVAEGAAATDLDEVVVTATRTEVALADSLFPAQVIDHDEIVRSQARSLTDLLRGRAGIDIGNQGGPGKLSNVFMRGAEADQVLVLVDGVRVGSVSAGLAAFQDLPVDQINRIEIVRGPRSSLYGSEAIGGVIQIFTRRDDGAFSPRMRAGIGSHGLREASAGIGGGGERGWFGADVAYQRTDGINACRGTASAPGAPFGAGCFADEPDRDGYRNSSVNLRGGVRLGETLELQGNALRAESRNEFDGSFQNLAENVQQVLGAKLAWTPTDRIDITTQLGRNDDRSENFLDDHAGSRVDTGHFYTSRETASLQADFAVDARNLLSAGADWQHDAVESNTAFDVTERDNTGVFLEYQGKFGAHRLQASVRNDDNEQFGSHTTGGIGYGLAFGDDYRLTANYATGFKAPTFNDLYYPFFGKPDLRPEESKGYNVGIAQYAQRYSWTLNAYETRIDDLISYDSSIFLPNNIDQARIRGVELTFDTTLAGWDLSAQLSHTDPRNQTRHNPDGSDNANRGNLLARRARNTGRVDVDRAFGKFAFGASLKGAGHRFDDAANAVRLGGYATFDLRASYAFHPDWTLEARVDNAFDRDYETVAWYNQPGREYGLSLRWAPAR